MGPLRSIGNAIAWPFERAYDVLTVDDEERARKEERRREQEREQQSIGAVVSGEGYRNRTPDDPERYGPTGGPSDEEFAKKAMERMEKSTGVIALNQAIQGFQEQERDRERQQAALIQAAQVAMRDMQMRQQIAQSQQGQVRGAPQARPPQQQAGALTAYSALGAGTGGNSIGIQNPLLRGI